MTENDKSASIADSAKPNAGRIYDFILGGNHNFEVDRIAAQQVLKAVPFVQKLSRLIRWFLGEAVRRVEADGITQFVDFASGLPTVDHIHQISPAGTKVIYSDIDPVTVAYGQEIIKDLPNVRFVTCRVEKPEELLNSPIVAQLFGNDRKVAFGFNGIAYFVSDDAMRRSMRVLYDWAAKGSRLFLCDMPQLSTNITSSAQESLQLYKNLGQPIFPRSLETLKDILKPWKLMEPGFKPLEEWIEVRGGVAKDVENTLGGNFLGAILEK